MADARKNLAGLASLHTHSRYCDGHGELAEYAREALAAGLSAWGASAHSPVPFPCEYAIPIGDLPAYAAEVRRLRDEYAGRLPVYLGLELDYLPGLAEFYARELFSQQLDYVVASVHYVDGNYPDAWCYDESEERFARKIAQRHGGDARSIVEDYFRRVGLMLRDAPSWGLPVIVGHLDRVVLWNVGDAYFPTDGTWYWDLIDGALSAVARSGCVLEINTSGWNKKIGAPNPNADVLRRAATRGIPVIVSADAHWPANVAQHFTRGLEVLRAAGFSTVTSPQPSGWRQIPLPTREPASRGQR